MHFVPPDFVALGSRVIVTGMKAVLGGLAALLVVAGIMGLVLFLTHRPDSTPAAGRSCTEVDVGFKTDELMRQNVDRFRTNKQVVDPIGETRADGYKRYMAQYGNDPSMRSLVSADTYPANVRLTPAPGVDREQLKADLRAAYPEASIQDPCNVPVIPSR
jgi:hypothetical protein